MASKKIRSNKRADVEQSAAMEIRDVIRRASNIVGNDNIQTRH